MYISPMIGTIFFIIMTYHDILGKCSQPDLGPGHFLKTHLRFHASAGVFADGSTTR